MAAGLMMLIKKGATTIAAVQTTSLEVSKTPVDISSYDDTGFVKYLSSVAQQQLTITVAGVESDHVLRDVALGATGLLTDITLAFPNALTTNDVVACDFFLTSYKEDGEFKGAQMFSATLASSGAWTRS